MTEQLIRSLIKELEIYQIKNIRILALSRYAIHGGMGMQFFAIDFPGIACMLILDEEWLSGLSNEEKKFVIGHELMHLSYYHSRKKLFYAFFSFISSYLVTESSISLLTTQFLQSLIGKACEYQADYESVKRLNCYKGAIDFFDRMEDYTYAIEEELPQWYLLIKYREYKKKIYSFFYTHHPSFQDRKKYLQSIFE